MKKIIIIAIALLAVLAFFQNSYASSPYITYEVTGIRSDGIVVKDTKGNFYFIEKNSDDIKVGDIVKYDPGRKRLRKSPWQLAKIIEMTYGTITLKLNNGEQREVNMRTRYRGKFNQGEQVFFKESTGQIEKTDFREPEEE